jgi:hypothetical protein
MLIDYVLSQAGVILVLKVRQDNTGAKPGQGFTGLTNSATGLIVGTYTDNEPTITAYTSAGSTISTIATLGAYVAPSAGRCNLKEYDATNAPGHIQLHLANARFAVAGAKELNIAISGVTGMADCDVKIPLRAVDPYLASFGLSLAKTTNLTGLNDIAATAVRDVDNTTPAAGSIGANLNTVAGVVATDLAGNPGVNIAKVNSGAAQIDPHENPFGTVVSATTTSVTLSLGTGSPAFNTTSNAYVGTGLDTRFLAFTTGANAGMFVEPTASSVSGGDLTIGFNAKVGVTAAASGDAVEIN